MEKHYYYTVYSVTNLLNRKFYIGCHKTKDPYDSYLGSGQALRRALSKYGRENFQKEVLWVFDNPKDMYAKEAELVNEELVALTTSYNLKEGGLGGWEHTKILEKDDSWKRFWALRQREGCLEIPKEIREERLRRAAKTKRSKYGDDVFSTFKGKKHTDETKKRMSEKAKERLKDPTKNSQYGTMWIYSLATNQSKKIKKTDTIPDGWTLGRKTKNAHKMKCCH